MAFGKRFFLFLITNILILITASVTIHLLSSFFGFQGYYQYLMVFAIVWGMMGAFISLLLSRKMAKWMMKVRVISPQEKDPRLRELVEIVHSLSRRAGLKSMPEVGVYSSPEINAFATGPSRSRSLVAVSSGLLSRTDKSSLKGVLGHEVAHIVNGDMVTLTLIQGIVNAFVIFFARILANLVSSQIDERYRFFVELATIIFFEIIFSILGSFVVNFFSRQREFHADKGGARLAGKESMLSALYFLKNNLATATHTGQGRQASKQRSRNRAFASLKISNVRKGGLAILLSTHPPLEKRIAVLERSPIL